MGQLDELYDLMETLGAEDPESRLLASASPLLLAMHMDKSVRAFPHMRYLDDHVVALCNLQLYPNGPGGPAEVWGRAKEGVGEYKYLGLGYSVAVSDAAFDCGELILCREGAGLRIGGPEAVPQEDRVVFRLAIALPPRHGKSLLVTEHLPQWFLLRHPTNSVVVSTYNATAAEKWGRSNQERFKNDGDRYPMASDGLPLAPLSSTMDNMSFRPGKDTGEITYRGFGGALTGTGWGLGIIDDPFKDQSDALSSVERDAKRQWYTSTFRSRPTRRRGAPPPMEVMMFTRWHEEDLAGAFAYEEDGETPRAGWCVLRLPALAEAGDPLGRAPGESLCPQLVPLSFLHDQQTASPTWFSALYQGRPTHQAGAMFARTRELPDGSKAYWHWKRLGSGYMRSDGLMIPGDSCVYFMTSDWATSTKTSADWSVLSLWAWSTDRKILLLIDFARERVSSETHLNWAGRFWDKHKALNPLYLGIEDRTFGTALINEMRAGRPDITIIPLKADKDKVTRVLGYAEAVKGGRALFPDPDSYADTTALENEHALFPKGKHDDIVDTGGYAWTQAQKYSYDPAPADDREYRDPTPYQRAARTIERMQGGRSHPYYSLLDRMNMR